MSTNDLQDSVGSVLRQYPLCDVVLAMARSLNNGEHQGMIVAGANHVAADVRVLLDVLGKLSLDALRPGSDRILGWRSGGHAP